MKIGEHKLQKQIRVNRAYNSLTWAVLIMMTSQFIIMYNIPTIEHHINYNDIQKASEEKSSDNFFNIAIFGLIGMLGIPMMIVSYYCAKTDDDKATFKYLQKDQIPKAEKLEGLKCFFCEGKIHFPTNIVKHLGVEETNNYLDFCEENKTSPSLYCCSCFSDVEERPNWQKSMEEMINLAEKYESYKNLYKDKLESISN